MFASATAVPDAGACRTIGGQVKKWAELDPSKPAFIFVDRTWKRLVLTRADVWRLSARWAAALRRRGLRAGDVVSNTLPNSPERLLTHLGVILAGGVSMNGQVFLKDGEDFVGSLRAGGCTSVILDPLQTNSAAQLLKARDKVVDADGRTTYPELPALRDVLEVRLNPGSQEKSFVEKLQEDEQEELEARDDVSPEDVALVWTTSGSTGFSKLVPLSHRKVLLFGDAFAKLLGLAPDEVCYNGGPLGWSCGSLTSYLTHGITRVLPDFSRHAAGEGEGEGVGGDQFSFIWELIYRERCAGAFLVPFHVERLLESRARRLEAGEGDGKPNTTHNRNGNGPDWNWKLKTLVSGGQPLKTTHLAAIGTLAEKLEVVYGSTETGAMTSLEITDPRRYTSCNNGLPMAGVEIKIVGEDGQEALTGRLGEVYCRSEQAFQGYLNVDDGTQKTRSPDGWIALGDIGSVNAEGEVSVFCRKAFSIMRGAYLLYPGWLETRLLACPGVLNVMIVPVPDPVLHQELCACVVTQPGVTVTGEEVKVFCEGLFLKDRSDHMTAVPKYFLFFHVLPTTSTGKTCRRSTTAEARRRLGLTDDAQ